MAVFGNNSQSPLSEYGNDRDFIPAYATLRTSCSLISLISLAWFNHHRLLEPIGYIPPAEAEANYWRQLEEKTELPTLT